MRHEALSSACARTRHCCPLEENLGTRLDTITASSYLVCAVYARGAMVEGASAESQKRSWLRHGPADLPDDGKPLAYGTRLAHHLRTRHFFGSVLVLVVIAIVLVCCRVDLQWYWLIIYAGDTLIFRSV